jgi:hypothetical protein
MLFTSHALLQTLACQLLLKLVIKVKIVLETADSPFRYLNLLKTVWTRKKTAIVSSHQVLQTFLTKTMEAGQELGLFKSFQTQGAC